MRVTPLTKVTRAAALALVLAGTGFAAMPAQAASAKSHSGAQVEFDIRIGVPGFKFRFGDHDRNFRHCLTNREVRRDLRDRGYREIRFVDRRGRIVHVEAERRNNDFLIAYNTCSGKIVDRDRI
jgi:hypothetical protein